MKGSGRGNSVIMQVGGKKSPVRTTDTAERILCQANILATPCRGGGSTLHQKYWHQLMIVQDVET